MQNEHFEELYGVTPKSSWGWWILKQILPFLKLLEPAPKKQDAEKQHHGRDGRVFCMGAILWILTVFALCYLFLALASWTTVIPVHVKDAGPKGIQVKWMVEPKEPALGSHYPWVIICKHVLEIIIFHHLCSNLMEPCPDLSAQKTEDLHLIEPTGLVLWAMGLGRRLCCRKRSTYWLSSFVTDNILLFIVGIFGVVHQIDMIFVKNRINSTLLLCDDDGGHFCIARYEIVLSGLTAAYVGILMVGFLFTTLFFGIVHAPSRKNEFGLLITLSWLLWVLEFLVIILNRDVYTSLWSRATSVERMVAAGAQIFITHGAAMLGAIKMGHSSHFRKCPDLTWRVFWKRIIPYGLVTGIFYAALAYRRIIHDWQLAHPDMYAYVVEPWIYGAFLWDFLGGSFLLWCAYVNGNIYHQDKEREIALERAHRESMDASHQLSVQPIDISSVLDYDGALIATTFSLAIFYNAATVFEKRAEGDWKAFAAELLRIAAPFGAAVFTFSVWRFPPKKGALPAKVGIWFAYVFCMTQFFVFQIKEDCHVSSDLPACCDYPSIGTEHLASTCDKSQRCLDKGNITIMKKTFNLYCAHASEHGGEHGASGEGGHGTPEEGGHGTPEEGGQGTPKDGHMFRRWQLQAARTSTVNAHVRRILGELPKGSHDEPGSHEEPASHGNPEPAPGSHDEPAPGSHENPGSHDAPGHAEQFGFGDCCCCLEHHKDWCKGMVVTNETKRCPASSHGVKEVESDCEMELRCRWHYYAKLGAASMEAAAHMSEESASYYLFEVVGMAMCVEMYFTITGILLKVIFLSKHPNSEQVAKLHVHHHKVDHNTGEHMVVTATWGNSTGGRLSNVHGLDLMETMSAMELRRRSTNNSLPDHDPHLATF